MTDENENTSSLVTTNSQAANEVSKWINETCIGVVDTGRGLHSAAEDCGISYETTKAFMALNNQKYKGGLHSGDKIQFSKNKAGGVYSYTKIPKEK